MNRISAEIIADSKNEFGDRITTFILTFPRIVLSEFNTHRMLSKNSASSRAIPYKKMLKKVWEQPFIPIRFMADHSGMQGNEYLSGWRLSIVKQLWLIARSLAILSSYILSKLGVTKQICNRVLEPFLYHTVICTGTEWENFFALRVHPAAEIHIADLAEKMLEKYNYSSPKLLRSGEWHVPFGDKFDKDKMYELIHISEPSGRYSHPEDYREREVEYKIKIATARCARVSYDNFEGKDDYFADVKLYDKLLSSGHMSPFEHCAKTMSYEEHSTSLRGCCWMNGTVSIFSEKSYGWLGNFRGFIQLRKTLQGENKTDNRVVK